jgi:hypothetical protein
VLDLRLNRFVWSAAGTAGACKSGHPFVKLRTAGYKDPDCCLSRHHTFPHQIPLGSIHLQRTLPVDKHHGDRSC